VSRILLGIKIIIIQDVFIHISVPYDVHQEYETPDSTQVEVNFKKSKEEGFGYCVGTAVALFRVISIDELVPVAFDDISICPLISPF
jgi:hypothetical protein